MNFAALKTECMARGFDFDSPTRWGYWINRAYTRVAEREAWTWLEDTETGSSPLTISDLGRVLSVADTTNDSILTYEDVRTLREQDPGLDDTGSPSHWYNSSPTVIACWPATSVNLSVRYLKVPSELSADGDEPLFPARWHYMLVDGAVSYAYRDADEYEAAANANDAFEAAILEMSDSQLVVNLDSPRSLLISGSTDW